MKTYRRQPSKTVPVGLLKLLRQQGLSQRQMLVSLKDKGIKICRSTLRARMAELPLSSCKQESGWTKKLTKRDERHLSRFVRVHSVRTVPQLLNELRNVGTKVSYSTVLRALHANPDLRLRRPRKRPLMTAAQQQQRFGWARSAAFNWSAIFYGDEKSFSLDGPDFRPRLWCDRRDKPLRLSRRGPHQDRVGFFGCFSRSTVPDLVQIPANYKSQDYCVALNQVLPARSVLMHDRHPVHKSAVTQLELKKRKVRALLLPPRAADLNPMENLWGVLVSLVYRGTKVYQTRSTLTHAVKQAWAAVQQDGELRENLVRSMPARVADVVARKGDFTHY